MSNIKKAAGITDYLANERTLLAWIRTSIGIMAFGFVVVKFSLFVRQISLLLEKGDQKITTVGYSDNTGIILVAVGSLTLILAYIRYRRTEKRLTAGVYHQSPYLVTIITFAIFAVSILLLIYLAKSI